MAFTVGPKLIYIKKIGCDFDVDGVLKFVTQLYIKFLSNFPRHPKQDRF